MGPNILDELSQKLITLHSCPASLCTPAVILAPLPTPFLPSSSPGIALTRTAFRANQQASKLNKTKSAAPGRGKPRQSNVTVQETGDEQEEEDDDDGGLADQSAMMDED